MKRKGNFSIIRANKIELTSRSMPCNVTMHQPRSRVVRFEGNGNITTSRQQSNISSRRIVKVERIITAHWVESLGALSEYYHVHAMPVERM